MSNNTYTHTQTHTFIFPFINILINIVKPILKFKQILKLIIYKMYNTKYNL